MENVTQSKVLVVEDNPINQKLLELIINQKSLEVDTASNGVEAISLFDNNSYRVIFMDINLPDTTGYEITEIVRTKNGTVPIIGVSGNSSEEDINCCKRCGMNSFISKPYRIEEIYKNLDQYI